MFSWNALSRGGFTKAQRSSRWAFFVIAHFSHRGVLCDMLLFAYPQNYRVERGGEIVRAIEWTIFWGDFKEVNKMLEDTKKRLKSMAYWLVGTVVVVSAALTAIATIWVFPWVSHDMRRLDAGIGAVLKAWLPILGVTALLAALFYAGYYLYLKRQAEA